MTDEDVCAMCDGKGEIEATDIEDVGSVGCPACIQDALHARIAELERDLADVDAMLACHVFAITTSPPSAWPRDSVLRAAIGRHTVRNAKIINAAKAAT